MLFITPNGLKSDGDDSRIHLGHRMVPVTLDMNNMIGQIAELDAYLELNPNPNRAPILLVIITAIIPSGLWSITMPESIMPQNNIMLSAVHYTFELNPHNIIIPCTEAGEYTNAAAVKSILAQLISDYVTGL